MADSEHGDGQLIRLRDAVLERAGTDPLMQARVLLELAGHLEERGLISEALWICGEISSRFRRATSGEILRVVADSTFLQATALGALGRLDDELVLYERILSELPASPHTRAITLFNKALRLSQRQEALAAVQTYCELIDKFREDDDPAVQLQVAMALINRAGVLQQAGRPDMAVVDCTDVVIRFRSGAGPLRRQWALGLYNQALFLATLMRYEESLRAFDEFIALFAETDDPALQQALATAVSSRAQVGAKIGKPTPG